MTWRNGISDPKLRDELEATLDEVRGASHDFYQDLNIGVPTTVRIAGHEFLTVVMSFTGYGVPSISQTYLTVKQGNLVKYRITMRLPKDEAIREAVEFIADDIASRGAKLKDSKIL